MRVKFYQWIAWRLPKPIVYWAAIRLMSFATVGKYGDTVVPDLTVTEALRRWEMALRERDL